MLIGAGNAGQMILRDIRASREISEKVCCIIDDNPNKWNRYIDGVPVVGGREDILTNVEKYHIDKIYLALPSATAEDKQDILSICNETDCELKQLPGLYQLAKGEVSVSAMKTVAIEDLLGREPIQVNMDENDDGIVDAGYQRRGTVYYDDDMSASVDEGEYPSAASFADRLLRISPGSSSFLMPMRTMPMTFR